jgi:multisubunit Na+/H+ antiporter MnhG subunit
VAGPATVPGRHRATAPAPRRRGRAGLLWPLAALVVVALVAARTLRNTPLPDDGALAGPAFALLRGESELSPLSPHGLGAVHTAVYATVTRAFQRQDSLTGAEREMSFVLLLLSAVLLWRTARRLGLPDPSCAVAVLALGAVGVLAPLHGAASPAALAVGWLLLAGWLTTRLVSSARPPVVIGALAVLAAALAVLLAPDVLLLLVAGTAASVCLAGGPGRRRAAAALVGVLLLAAVRVLVQRWDPQPDDPARWGGSSTGLVLLSVVLVLTGALAAWRLPRFRAAGTALGATVAVAVAPPSGRLPALLLCLPLAALLAGALLAAVAAGAARPLPNRPRALVGAGPVAVLLLLGLGSAASAELAGGGHSDFGAAATAHLADWMDAQLPADAAVTASPRLTAELLHAGADPTRLRRGDAPAPAATGATAPVLRVTAGAPGAGTRVVARFGELAVVEAHPVLPPEAAVTARRDLAAALLANPTTQVPTADADLLAAGQVDPRLLSLLAGMAARLGIGLHALPAVPGEPAGALRRQAVVHSIGGRPVADDPAAAQQLRTYLAAQRDPYAPDRATEADGGLLLGYDLVPDPDGLLPTPGGR